MTQAAPPEASIATIANVFNKLSYEPVLDSDSTVKV